METAVSKKFHIMSFKDEGEIETAVSEGRLKRVHLLCSQGSCARRDHWAEDAGRRDDRLFNSLKYVWEVSKSHNCLTGLQCVSAALRRWWPGGGQRALCAGRLSDSDAEEVLGARCRVERSGRAL